MNKNKWLIALIGMVMIGVTAASLTYLRKHQRLGKPGIKANTIAGSERMDVFLPETVLAYSSIKLELETNLFTGLPHDTSFAARLYLDRQPDRTNWVQTRIVMMGTDRTSIHKPEFCLTGIGYNITKSDDETIRIEGDHPFDLQVKRLLATQETEKDGKRTLRRGIYYYWFVAEDEQTASHATRMWKTATHLIKTGELRRWAYVSCFLTCVPGTEDIASERARKFIAAAVPKFQLSAGSGESRVSVPPERALAAGN